jgi:hypothetical protein
VDNDADRRRIFQVEPSPVAMGPIHESFSVLGSRAKHATPLPDLLIVELLRLHES